MQPLVQIVHISDLHIKDIKNPPAVVKMLNAATKAGVFIRSAFKGVAGAHPHVFGRFETAIREFTTGQHGWSGPTWLVDTGDLSSLGDKPSLDKGKKEIGKLAKLCAGQLLLHGNHDAWPRDVPTAVSKKDRDRHRKWLRANHYPDTWPEPPLTHDNGIAEVQLFGLNTVLHNRLPNAFAFGKIEHDRYWQKQRRPTPDEQLNNLVNQIAVASTPARPILRLVATHHPVHFPSRRPWDTVVRKGKVARELERQGNAAEIVQVILSGHTHETFPALGQLPRQAPACKHGALGSNQLQLVIGTLSQDDPEQKRDPANEAQVLRTWWDERRGVFVLERILLRRPGPRPGRRSFRYQVRDVFLPSGSRSTPKGELVDIPL